MNEKCFISILLTIIYFVSVIMAALVNKWVYKRGIIKFVSTKFWFTPILNTFFFLAYLLLLFMMSIRLTKLGRYFRDSYWVNRWKQKK